MCVTDHHDMTLVVKVALNLKTTNQPIFSNILLSTISNDLGCQCQITHHLFIDSRTCNFIVFFNFFSQWYDQLIALDNFLDCLSIFTNICHYFLLMTDCHCPITHHFFNDSFQVHVTSSLTNLYMPFCLFFLHFTFLFFLSTLS